MSWSRFLWLGALVLAPPAFAERDIYMFVDDDGVRHFTNMPSDPRYQIYMTAAREVTRSGERVGAESMLAASRRYAHIIDSEARRNRVDPALLHAVITVESGYNPMAVSRAGARGIMQLMPDTARQYGVRDVFDPAQNIRAGAALLADLKARYRNDLKLVLAAYNAGAGAVDRHGQRVPPFEETMIYVPRVLGIYSRLRNSLRS
jgi:soluble lytic murein transglycosylase-like protein